MAIALPERTASAVSSLTPRQIVSELDKFVVGQGKAKRAVPSPCATAFAASSSRRDRRGSRRRRTSS